MSVIAVRDGVLALDSAVMDDDIVIGSVKKWSVVPEERGGGFVAGVGRIATMQKGINLFVELGERPSLDEDTELLWLRGDGTVSYITCYGAMDNIEAPFFATGSGRNLARGAMAHGATAEEAVKIACDLDITCWGPVIKLELPKADGR